LKKFLIYLNFSGPEIFTTRKYGVEVDIWALGITCIEMETGNPPYFNIDKKEALRKIITKGCYLQNPTSWSEEFQDFCSRCLVKDPKQRATASSLLRHPFIFLSKK
jgi:serine/threonine kinase 3